MTGTLLRTEKLIPHFIKFHSETPREIPGSNPVKGFFQFFFFFPFLLSFEEEHTISIIYSESQNFFHFNKSMIIILILECFIDPKYTSLELMKNR